MAPAACGTHVGIEESLLASRVGFRVSVVYVNDVVNNSEAMYVCLALCSVFLCYRQICSCSYRGSACSSSVSICIIISHQTATDLH